MKQTTFVQKVTAFLKGGDEAKLARFDSKLRKYFQKQISMRNDKIENLQDKIVDSKEVLSEVILGVDIDKINSTDGAESYCVSYVRKVQEGNEAIESFEDQVLDLKEEVADLEKLVTLIYGEE